MRTWLFVLFAGLAISAPSAINQVIYVDANAPAGGNGTGAEPYNTIADAVAQARTAGGLPTVEVKPGIYQLASPITIDFPLNLTGSNVMEIDSNLLPTGVVAAGTETQIVGLAALGASPLVSAGRTDGVVIYNVSIQNFTFVAGPGGGDDIAVNQVQNFTVSQNLLTGPPTVTTTNQGIGSVASSGSVLGNYITGVGCGACIRAGYPGSPALVDFIGNRTVNNRNAGAIFSGATYGITEQGDELYVLVAGNDISENTASGAYGLRFFVIRKDLPDTQSTGNVTALALGNRIVGNDIGFTADAGFPYRQANIPPSTTLVCDTRVYSGSLNLTLLGNTLSGSLLTNAVISFTRVTATLKPSQLPSWQYLHNGTYIINDPENSLAGYLKDDPETDPFVGGLCAADTTHELLNNTLIFNGVIVQPTP